jgi:urocanate hydratase
VKKNTGKLSLTLIGYLKIRSMNQELFVKSIVEGIPTELPENRGRSASVAHAPARVINRLSIDDKRLAIRNALRYFPKKWHSTLAPEFSQELENYGRIYMYRFKPEYPLFARPIDEYPAQCKQAAAIMLMIHNNLDPLIAKYPEELITYGGNGAVFQNWIQYRLVMYYLSKMTNEQTLVMYSGHPMGLFPSNTNAPRVIVTNGMMIPNYSSKKDWNYFNAIGVTQYGQMTAGSYMYIGPQGIVHGTTITLMNAGRKKGLGTEHLSGALFVSSGLGGMSGAQALAAVVSGCVGVIAETDIDAVEQRMADGYICRENVYSDLNQLCQRIIEERKNARGIALVFQGNVVDLWEKLLQKNIQVDLGSDQTSLHNIDDCGYTPVGYTFEEARELLVENKKAFLEAVRKSLVRHVDAVNAHVAKGMYFWDYGNAFLKEAGESNADIWLDRSKALYKYNSYVQDILGPLCFDYGFGPFRWVCCSGLEEDLELTDRLAEQVLHQMENKAPAEIKGQLKDNIRWIREAKSAIPAVGSKARILYADAEGRIRIAEAFNQAIANGELKGPVVLGRDHHDVSGTDSPFRETSNIYDGSKFTADMAIQNVIGDSFRGATWVSIHNGGGVGWGEVINGGFGMMLDGSDQSHVNLRSMLHWDVNNGIARRAWARNEEAVFAIKRAMEEEPRLQITLPNMVDDETLDNLFS